MEWDHTLFHNPCFFTACCNQGWWKGGPGGAGGRLPVGAGEGRRARAIGAKRGMDAKDGSETEVLLDCLFLFLKSHFFH